MKKSTSFILALLAFICSMSFSGNATACYAFFTYDRACAGDTVWFHPADPNAVYCWTFNDTASFLNVTYDQEPYHVFDTPGTYYVTLFTNIGAEWDYYTTAVVITSDCLQADFMRNCWGSLQYQFTDYSSGHPVTWSWNFGDPASGVNNTSFLASPSHTFSGAGSYNVQLIISDGSQSDTVIYTLQVSTNCIDASFSPSTMVLPCTGDTFTPNASYNGSITGYLWNFGDPASGISNIAITPDPYHIYAVPGIYTIRLIVTDGSQNDTSYTYVEVVDCSVWPGDANKDLEVNGDDLFPIGLYYGMAGVSRPGASSLWVPQSCNDWPGFQSYMYLQDLVNAKHADCNGDGVINQSDITYIINNFGRKSASVNNHSAMLFTNSDDTELGFIADSVDALSGATMTMPVNLGIEDSAMRIYGCSFTIKYDPDYILNTLVDFNSSWLGTENTDMITVNYNDTYNGELHIACVRNTKTTRNGLGPLVTVHFNMMPGAYGLTTVTISPEAKVITNGMYSYQNNQMVVIPVELRNLVVNAVAAVDEYTIGSCRVYPNPAGDFIYIGLPESSMATGEIEILDVTGKAVLRLDHRDRKAGVLQVKDLSPGCYVVKVETGQSIYTTRFIKM